MFVQRLHDGAHGYGLVVAVEAVQVVVGRPLPGMGVGEIRRYVIGCHAPPVTVVVAALTEDEGLIAHTTFLHPSSQYALAGAVAVQGGRVEGGDARCPHRVEKLEVLFGMVLMQHDRAVHDARDLLVRPFGLTVFHLVSSSYSIG